MRRQVLSLLVENTSGVLSHISGLFSRRGYNIDSFSAGVTADDRFTRITVTSHGDDQVLEQIRKQLEDVVDIKELKPEKSVYRELVLIKLRARPEDRQNIIPVANIFRAKIIDVSSDSMVIELTGDQGKLEAFIDLMRGYDILELARTGETGLSRGDEDVIIL